jgi:hypothetical protein
MASPPPHTRPPMPGTTARAFSPVSVHGGVGFSANEINSQISRIGFWKLDGISGNMKSSQCSGSEMQWRNAEHRNHKSGDERQATKRAMILCRC